MQLTTKGRYAVTAMLDLSIYGQDGPVKLADISARQGITVAYLEQLFAKLRRGGLVNSVRGPGGGYKLDKDSSEISVSEVINAVDEKMDVTNCGGKGDCFQGEICMTHHLWEDLSNQLQNFLGSISLASLIEQQAHRQNVNSPDTQKIELKALS